MEAVGAALVLAAVPLTLRPSADCKARLSAMIEGRPQEPAADCGGFVVTCPGGFVRWVNPAFLEMCGYSFDELRGKKLGPILQGADTDRDAVARMRSAVHERRPCHETILNYHKNGTPYWVEIDLAPIIDDDGQPRFFVARERECQRPLAA